MANISFACFKCQKSLSYIDTVGFREACPNCNEDVHVCRNCGFYDRNSYNECREPSAEVVREKDRANFCDFFKAGGGLGASGPTKDDMRAKAEALFKKKV